MSDISLTATPGPPPADGLVQVVDINNTDSIPTYTVDSFAVPTRNSRGPLWAECELPTNTFATRNTEITVTWTNHSHSPLIVDGARLKLPALRTGEAAEAIGMWIVSENPSGTEIRTQFTRWAASNGIYVYCHSSNANCRLNFNIDATLTIKMLTINDNITFPANTFIKVYAAVSRGARGPAGPAGPEGPTGLTGAAGAAGATGADGPAGDAAWTPTFSMEINGQRRLVKIPDWVGGGGDKPAVNLYIAATGLSSDVANAIDIRGPTGQRGDPGATGLTGPAGADGDDAWTPVFALEVDGDDVYVKVIDWTGGTDPKPAINQYITPTGLSASSANAVNIKGDSWTSLDTSVQTGYWTTDVFNEIPDQSDSVDFLANPITGGSAVISSQSNNQSLFFALPNDDVFSIKNGSEERIADFQRRGAITINSQTFYLYGSTTQSGVWLDGTWTFVASGLRDGEVGTEALANKAVTRDKVADDLLPPDGGSASQVLKGDNTWADLDGLILATDAEFATGTSTTKAPNVQQVKNVVTAQNPTLSKWTGEVSPIDGSLEAKDRATRVAAQTLASPWDAANNRWRISNGGAGAANHAGLFFRNADIDWTQAVLRVEIGQTTNENTGGGNAANSAGSLGIYFGGANNDFGAGVDPAWVGAATAGLGFWTQRLAGGAGGVHNDDDGKWFMQLRVNDSAARTAGAASLSGSSGYVKTDAATGICEYMNGAESSSYVTSNAGILFPITDEKINCIIYLFGSNLYVVINDLAYVKFRLPNTIMPVRGTTMGPQYGFLGDTGGSVRSGKRAYLYEIAVGTPEPSDINPFLGTKLPPISNDTGIYAIERNVDDELAAINISSQLPFSAASIYSNNETIATANAFKRLSTHTSIAVSDLTSSDWYLIRCASNKGSYHWIRGDELNSLTASVQGNAPSNVNAIVLSNPTVAGSEKFFVGMIAASGGNREIMIAAATANFTARPFEILHVT